MKKTFIIAMSLIFCLMFSLNAYAMEENEVQPPQEITDSSQPRIMVTKYTIDGDYITPGENVKLSITFKNYSTSKVVSNIKLTLTDESGEIKADSTGTQFVGKINANSSYTWDVDISASKLAQTGEHKLLVTSEYEDKYYNAFSSDDTLYVDVRQSVSLDYDGVRLPKKVYQGDTVTVDINLMNTGKADIRNARLNFDIESIESGGTVFAGEIPAGENLPVSANLRISDEKLGDVSGKVTLYYEDEFGTEYSKEAVVSTVIDKKIEVEEETEEEKEKKNPQWWIFVIIGAVSGGTLGFAVPAFIRSKKQQKEDELRL